MLKARLRYSGQQPLEITPHHCRPRGKAIITAQATWPRTALSQGEETQLLIALRAGDASLPMPAGPGLTATTARAAGGAPMSLLTDHWSSLSPKMRRALALSAGGAVIAALAWLMATAPAQHTPRQGERERLVTNLLTDVDPRELGIDGLGPTAEAPGK